MVSICSMYIKYCWLHNYPKWLFLLTKLSTELRAWISNHIQYFSCCLQLSSITYPESKVHGANMGPIWGRQDPGGPYVCPCWPYVCPWILLSGLLPRRFKETVVRVRVRKRNCIPHKTPGRRIHAIITTWFWSCVKYDRSSYQIWAE